MWALDFSVQNELHGTSSVWSSLNSYVCLLTWTLTYLKTKCSELKTSECISHKVFYTHYYIFIILEYFSGISVLPLFLPYLSHVLYRKRISIAFLGNVNVRFMWERRKDQLSSVIYVYIPHEKWWILYSSLLLFLNCVE